MTPEAQQRLEAIQEATELGSGFRIAMRDLEIRGAGNLLGAEQSGHIAAVGFDLYSRLLEQAVKQLKQMRAEDGKEGKDGKGGKGGKGGKAPATPPPAEPAPQAEPAAPAKRKRPVVHEKILVSPLVTLDLPLTAYLPEDYIPDEEVRLNVYQRMVDVQSPGDVRGLQRELRDRFGEVPPPAEHLLTWLYIKALALAAGVSSVITTDSEFIVQLPVLDASARERLRQQFGADPGVRVGPQFVRLDRRMLDGAWTEKLASVLDALASRNA
jgi:transcription-repair coupling factor (superfamily II helicase)